MQESKGAKRQEGKGAEEQGSKGAAEGQSILGLAVLLAVPHVDSDCGFELSQDRRVAFSHNASGQWEVYVAPLDGSLSPRQVSSGAGAKFAPRWSPDGGRLIYVLDAKGGEVYDIALCDLSTGEQRNLTPGTPDSLQPNLAWSPDGTQIAFLSDRGGHFDCYVMAVDGGPVRRVLALDHPQWDVRWSPDGRWLAVVAETSGQDYDTFLVPAAGGEPRVLAGADGPLHARDAAWSPDGQRIAFAANERGAFDIGVYELATGVVTRVSSGDGDEELPAWSPDGRRLAGMERDGPSTRVIVWDVETRAASRYEIEPGVHYAPRFVDETHLALLFDSPRRPCDLWTLDLRDGSAQQLTHSLPSELQDAPFTMPEWVDYPSLDGRRVPALLYRPPTSGRPAPAVVYIHGGPNWLSQVTWEPLVQHMVSRGWVVLAPNYRGSTGYGREWQLANRFDLGGGDTQDVVAGADYLLRTGLADPARVAITGRSYGGYLTMACLTQYPDRWSAGSAVVPFLNWFSSEAREDLLHWDRENMGDPVSDYQRFYDRSPFFFLDRVQAAVQLIAGAHDPRCPAGESTRAHQALLAQGKRCELALYEDEGHTFLRQENVVDAQKRRVAFLAAVLEGTS